LLLNIWYINSTINGCGASSDAEARVLFPTLKKMFFATVF
jgi:hypothetical protein